MMPKFSAVACALLCAVLAACGKDTTAPADTMSCTFAKQAVWLASGSALPVPDTLMNSNKWNLPAPWYLGDETTTFEPAARGCLVFNH
jgi:hypothetical protein